MTWMPLVTLIRNLIGDGEWHRFEEIADAIDDLLGNANEPLSGGSDDQQQQVSGGVASALHEMADKAGVSILLREEAIPIRPPVRAAAEVLGIDPLFIANEGKALIGVRPEYANALLRALHSHPRNRGAARRSRDRFGICRGRSR